ncbi:heme NO-binding domain-containing protein [Belliella kenyensis]|uniref:Heme NO-binding domain-containing protein n=1 Tax=Belliella kenyensis TaxID=1472724 RepID=A0ABV8ERX3_9BACT|nr:heme NO-binding domain-containing protein [Belliella kenyensis]MCH7402274.1 heme NO-binding domain-containing protein [Belliella kenyensis]MDN3601790.1 heme NO-binding domain-containing protein [Belliella kenyensis]
MYGLVNKAIQDLITTNYGEDKWMKIKEKSKIDIDYFISTEPYDDSVTYQLAIAAAQELNISVDEVLYSFGEWWVLKTSLQKYGGLMKAGGSTVKEFLTNLPSFHDRIMLIYPKLTPPEFKIDEKGENCLIVHYFSKREGLVAFMKGLLSGIGKMYETPVEIEHVFGKSSGEEHEAFKVSW